MGDKDFYKKQIDNLSDYIHEMNSRPIFFIGSGFSQRYIKTPNWEELLEYLIEDNSMITRPLQYYIQKFDGDLSEVATELVGFYYEYAWEHKNEFPEHLYNSKDQSIYLKYKIAEYLKNLSDKFEIPQKLKSEISILKTLSPHSIITTNYDSLIEKLFPDYEVIVGQEIIKEKSATDIGHILKVHGSIDDISSLIIAKKDYDEFNSKQIYLISKLFTYFVEHPIIFIGYSINDDNIKSILSNVKKIYGVESGNKLENLWFIDWSMDELTNNNGEGVYEKNVDVGGGENVRLNYIKQHSFGYLYNALYQNSVDINLLKDFEAAVYNVVKSESITDMKVDIASLRYLTESSNVLRTFTHSPLSDDPNKSKSLLSFALINEANQLATQYDYTATELSQKIFSDKNAHWSKAYKLFDQIEKKWGINLRKSNNTYHIELKGISRYTENAVELLKKVKNKEEYVIEFNGRSYSSKQKK